MKIYLSCPTNFEEKLSQKRPIIRQAVHMVFIFSILFVSCKSEAITPSLNNPPVIEKIEVKPSTIRVYQTATITAYASDPDGDDLTFEWEATLGYIYGSGGTVKYSASLCCAGTNTIKLTVKDGRGGSATGTAMITVLP